MRDFTLDALEDSNEVSLFGNVGNEMENANCIFWCVEVGGTKTELKVWKVVPYKDRVGLRSALAQIRAAEIREEYPSGNQDDPNWALPYVGEVGWHAYNILKEGEILVAIQNDESYGIASYAIVKSFTSQLRNHLEDYSVYNDVCRGRPCLMYDNFRSFAFDWTGKVIYRSSEREAHTLKTPNGSSEDYFRRADLQELQACPADILWEEPNTYWLDRVDSADETENRVPFCSKALVLDVLPKHHCKCQILAKQADETTFLNVGFDIPMDDSKFDVQAARDHDSFSDIYHEIKSLWTCWIPPDMPTVQIHCQSRFGLGGVLTFSFFIQDDTPIETMPFRVFKVEASYPGKDWVGWKASWYNENYKKLSYNCSINPKDGPGKLRVYYGV
jgi:hypothetical protein